MKYIIKPNPLKEPAVPYKRIDKDEKGHEIVIDDRSITRGPGTRDTYMAAVSRTTGRILTGMDETVTNPYKDNKSFRSPEWEKLLKDKEQVTKQTVLEYKHGHDKPGTYTSNWISPEVTRDVSKLGYFQTMESAIELNDGATILDDANPLDEAKIHMVKANKKKFADSIQNLQGQGYYIVAETEDGKEKIQLKQRKNECISKLTEISNKGESAMTSFFKVLFLGKAENQFLRNINKDRAYSEVDTWLSTDKNVQDHLTAFEQVYNLFHNEKEVFNARALAFDAISSRVITRMQNKYSWIPPASAGLQEIPSDWTSLSDVVAFLSDPTKDAEQNLIEAQIRDKK